MKAATPKSVVAGWLRRLRRRAPFGLRLFSLDAAPGLVSAMIIFVLRQIVSGMEPRKGEPV